MTPIPCHDDSLARREPMPGSADQVDTWLLLEYPGDWAAKALGDNALGKDTNHWLKQSLRAIKAQGRQPKALFVRQPEARREGIRLLLCLAAPQPLLLQFEARDPAGLERVDLAACSADPDACGAQRLHEPQYLVCANAQRDQCCGRYGVPAYLALRERLGDRVWQCTHVGGHRFAPNVLRLPDGVLYGRVNVGEVSEFLARVESGGVATRWLRGRSAWPPHVQAAESMLGDLDTPARYVDDVKTADDGWRVRFDVSGTARDVEVRLGDAIEVLASCGDTSPKRVQPFVSRS